MGKSAILDKRRIATGNWLFLEEIIYSDHHGEKRTWESAMRLKGRGAVAIIAVLKPSDRIILVRQFRPPAGAYVIEFPAGLIDGDEPPETTATRELLEETGYSGRIVKISPPLYNSPGLSGETTGLAIMEIDENDPRNKNPETNFDDGEHVETFLVPLKDMSSFLDTCYKKGDLLDAKAVSFAEGLGTSR